MPILGRIYFQGIWDFYFRSNCGASISMVRSFKDNILRLSTACLKWTGFLKPWFKKHWMTLKIMFLYLWAQVHYQFFSRAKNYSRFGRISSMATPFEKLQKCKKILMETPLLNTFISKKDTLVTPLKGFYNFKKIFMATSPKSFVHFLLLPFLPHQAHH